MAVEVSSLELVLVLSVLVLSFSEEALGLFSLEKGLETSSYAHELGTLTESPVTTYPW